MKWPWFALLAGMGLYVMSFIPGFLPHSIDIVVISLAGVMTASVAVFGFESTHISKQFSTLLIAISAIMFTVGIMLMQQGHNNILWLISVPATGFGLFGFRKLWRNT